MSSHSRRPWASVFSWLASVALLVGFAAPLAAHDYQIIEAGAPALDKAGRPVVEAGERKASPAREAAWFDPAGASSFRDAGRDWEVEPNNDAASAMPIDPSGSVIRGTIWPVSSTAVDQDFFSFSALAGDKVYAATMTSGSAAGTGTTLALLDSDGATVIEEDVDDGAFSGTAASLAGTVIPANGTYYLRVVRTGTSTLQSARVAPYDLYLRVQSGSPAAEVEPNGTTATATPLPAGGWVSGVAAAGGDGDFFSLSLQAGDTVFISVDADPERDGVGWNPRTGLGLFGSGTPSQILVVNDGNVGTNPADPASEAFFFTVLDAGTYFAYVDHPTGLGSPTSTYEMSVTVIPYQAPSANCTTYSATGLPIALPAGPADPPAISTITVPGNPRIADVNVRVELDHTFMSDLDALLISPAGNVNGLFSNIGAGTVGGPQTTMRLVFDDEAAIPPAFALSSAWRTQPEVNYRLSWFDGENGGGDWTLEIRDDFATDGGNLTAWSIEICEPDPEPVCDPGFEPVTVYESDFEADDGGFTHSGVADEWERGLPSFGNITSCASGSNCWKTDLDDTYDASSDQELLSPTIDLADLSGPIVLRWSQRYRVENASFDNYFVTAREVGAPENSVTAFEWVYTSPTEGMGGSPNSHTLNGTAGWGQYSARLDDLAGLPVEVAFRLVSDSSVNFDGVAIDDVSVTACQPAKGGGENELLVIDLSEENRVTITATTGTSLATVSGSTTTGFYFEDFFSNTGNQGIGTATIVGTATLTAASVPPDGSPALFRSLDSDAGLNVWSYSATATTTFTQDDVAFAGTATWSITPALYAAMLTAPETGDVWFPADDVTDLGTAQMLGTYRVIFPGAQPPKIEVDPSAIESVQQPKSVVEVDLGIHNAGDENLDWEISETEAEVHGLGVTGFEGDFDVSNWTLVNTPPETAGTVDTSSAPASVKVVGGDTGSEDPGTTDFQITIPDSGVMTFSWSYFSTDEPNFDRGAYVVNGVQTDLSGTSGQSGSVEISLSAGDTFAFRVETDDNLFGAGELTISNFTFDVGGVIGGCADPASIPWLSVSQTAGTTAPDATTNVTVTLDASGLAEGVYEAALCIESNDPNQPELSVPVTMTVALQPDIVVDPVSLESTQAPNTTNTVELDISNEGDGVLDWEIFELEGDAVRVPASDGRFPRGIYAPSLGVAPERGFRHQTEKDPVASLGGITAYAINNATDAYVNFDVATPQVLTAISTVALGGFIGAGEVVDGSVWMLDVNNNLAEVDPVTGSILGTTTTTAPTSGHTWTGMALDPTDGTVYASASSCAASSLYTMDLATGTATFIGNVSNAGCLIGIAIDGGGNLWGYDIVADAFLSINKSTGAGTVIGSIGFDANFGQGLGWEPTTDTLYMAAFNNAAFAAELRIVDRTTGATTLVGALGSTQPGGTNQVGWVGFELSGLGCSNPSDLSWVSVDPTSGSTNPGATTTVDVTFDSTGLAAGTYEGVLCIESNDPDEPVVEVPVSLTVEFVDEMPFIDGFETGDTSRWSATQG